MAVFDLPYVSYAFKLHFSYMCRFLSFIFITFFFINVGIKGMANASDMRKAV